MAARQNRPVSDSFVTVNIANVSSASTTFVPVPKSGKVVAAWGIMNSSVNTADAVLVLRTSGSSAMTNGTIILPTSGSSVPASVGVTPSANNDVVEGDFIQIASCGASSGNVAGQVALVIRG